MRPVLSAALLVVVSLLAVQCSGYASRAMPGAAPVAARADAGAPEGRAAFDTETYDHIVENAFLDPTSDPLSTFAVDVDTASYSNVRRFLTNGDLPPAGAVRIEEMINAFTYAYPDPGPDVPFSITTEVAPCPWNARNQLVHIGLQGRRVDRSELPPCNLVFLIDVSGSMGAENKLPLVLDALRMLTDGLREQDTVAIAVYAGAAGEVLAPTSGADKQRIRDALGKLRAGGSTNGGEGVKLAYSLAHKAFQQEGVNRVILCTDGDFNIGMTSQSELVDLVEREREKGVALTALGFGMGNYKDSTLEKLADHGNGNYAYVDNQSEARRVLVTESAGTLWTIAKDVKIQVEFNPTHVAAYRLIGYENRLLEARDFDDDTKDAGEIGAGHSVTALYEIVPATADSSDGSTDALRYQSGRTPTDAAASGELLTLKLRYKDPDGTESRLLTRRVMRNDATMSPSEAFRFSAAVAGFGMVLRGSEHKGDVSFEMIKDLARGALGQDEHARRAEFLKLVHDARELAVAGRTNGN